MLTAPEGRHGAAHNYCFYRDALATLDRRGVSYLVGGAWALERYTGIARDTKDFDIFTLPADAQHALDALAAAGYATELLYPHWLGKARHGDHFIDIIFSSGNGVATVDDGWFEHARAGEVLGRPVQLCPPEEMIWSKAFVLERERYDGADIAHLIQALGPQIDWRRVLNRFNGHWRVLFSHLILYGFAYPAERSKIPPWVLRELAQLLVFDLTDDPRYANICQGTLLSRSQYLPDVEAGDYQDARALPDTGTMRDEDIVLWTKAARADEGGGRQ